MRKEEFCEILGEINEKHIMDARKHHKYKKFIWLKWGSVAACVIISITCIATTIATVNDVPTFVGDGVSTSESPGDEKNLTEVLQNGTEHSITDIDQVDDTDQTHNTPENYVISIELQERIAELSSADSLGWIVYGDNVYMQNWKIDHESLNKEKDNIKLSESLGYASDFIGYYQNSSVQVDGNVYMVADNPNILCIKLNNGGTVWLGIEE